MACDTLRILQTIFFTLGSDSRLFFLVGEGEEELG